MKTKLLIALFTLMSVSAHAAEMSVIDVRRNITLAEDDTVYKDFYINGSVGTGLKKNLVVTVIRKLNVRDASGANAYGEIFVPVGKLKVIAVYDSVAVAREFELLSRDELPMLEQIGIMNGDRIDLSGSFIDNSKPKPKRKVAAEVQQTPAAVVTAAVAVVTPPSAPTPAGITPPTTPAVAALASAPEAQKLEKTADSGNTTH